MAGDPRVEEMHENVDRRQDDRQDRDRLGVFGAAQHGEHSQRIQNKDAERADFERHGLLPHGAETAEGGEADQKITEEKTRPEQCAVNVDGHGVDDRIDEHQACDDENGRKSFIAHSNNLHPYAGKAPTILIISKFEIFRAFPFFKRQKTTKLFDRFFMVFGVVPKNTRGSVSFQ